MFVRTRGNKGAGTCLWDLAAGTLWVLFFLSWLQTHYSMENGGKKDWAHRRAVCLLQSWNLHQALQTKAMSFTPPAWCSRNVSCLWQQGCSSTGLGFLHIWDCEEYKCSSWGFIEADPCVWGSPKDARKGKCCCLIIKGRTLFAPACIAWWVLWLRNNTAGAILLFYALAFLKFH